MLPLCSSFSTFVTLLQQCAATCLQNVFVCVIICVYFCHGTVSQTTQSCVMVMADRVEVGGECSGKPHIRFLLRFSAQRVRILDPVYYYRRYKIALKRQKKQNLSMYLINPILVFFFMVYKNPIIICN